jgi:hypothetical protein
MLAGDRVVKTGEDRSQPIQPLVRTYSRSRCTVQLLLSAVQVRITLTPGMEEAVFVGACLVQNMNNTIYYFQRIRRQLFVPETA